MEPIIPHKDSMRLIDSIIEFGKDFIVAKTTIKENCIFNDDGEVSSIIGIELIAQTVAAYAGIIDKNTPPKIGYLIGSRSYKSNKPNFTVGSELIIRIKQEFLDGDGLGMFTGEINGENNLYCSAKLNVYYPRK